MALFIICESEAETLTDAVTEAVIIASKTLSGVRFIFNGQVVTLRPEDDRDEIIKKYRPMTGENRQPPGY